ncbi:MAG: hypothetical protein V3V06_06700, partial [Dehalococcoidia bacterium]
MAPDLRAKDAAAVAAMPDIVSTHTYEAGWYNNATFVFPLLGAVGTLIAWTATGSVELLGLSIFLFVVTGVMLPLVYLTWQHTPTAVVVRESRIDALHQGHVMETLAWHDVTAVRRVETMGNVRWYVVGPDGDHLTLEGEIAELETLLSHAARLAGVELEEQR